MALDQIGQKLKNARESHGLSLGQIFERTKIPINHLDSIDNGLVDELPEPVYVAGYIKRYADCVGLNGQGLSDEYRKLNGGSNGNKSNGASSMSSRMAGTPVIISAPSYSKGADLRPPNILKQGLWYFLLIVMVVGIMAFLIQWQSNYSANNQTDPAQGLLQRKYSAVNTLPSQQPAPGAPGAPAQPGQPGQPAPTGDAAPIPLPADSEAAVSVTASQHVWVEVTGVSTGQNLYTGFMERGDRKDYKDPQGVRVHAGNGASLTVENQGKSETLGLPGKVGEKVFMSKTASASAGVTDPKAQAAAAAAAAKAALAVKKPIKHVVAPDAAPKHRVHSSDENGGGSAGSSGGSHSSIDVPYRYTESND
jgi:cytoskeletal protein RodZ